jgi:pimeloyl-ACP methyl ester carboxylesterase
MSPWSGLYFEPLLAAMGRDRLSIAIDTPGYGNSDPSPFPPAIEDYAASMGDAVDGLGIGRFDVLGDRTGAKTAVELALQRPDQVRRLVLVSPVVWTPEQRAIRREFARETVHANGAHLVGTWALSVGLSMPGRSLERFGEIFHTRHLHHDIAHWGRRAAAGYSLADGLDALDKPVLVLRPKDEVWATTPRVAPHLRHPASRLLDLPTWGYGFFEVETERTAAHLREFLDEAF